MEFFRSYHDVVYSEEVSKKGSNNSFNSTIDLVEDSLAEFHFCVITNLCGVHFPFIVVFNSAVMYIIWSVRRLHTSENYMLFAMAFVDFMSAMSIPVDIIDAHHEYRGLVRSTHALCVFRFSLPIMWDNSALLLLTAMCIGRYAAIIHPFWYHRNVGGKTSMKITVGVLLWGICFNVILFAVVLNYKEEKHDLREKCSFQNTPNWYRNLSFSILILNLVVSFVLSVCVAREALKQLRVTQSMEKQMGKSAPHRRQQTHQVQTMLFLMFTFLIVWVPITAIPVVYHHWPHLSAEVYLAVTRHGLYINASVKTVVYFFSKPIFRTSYTYLLMHRPCQWKELNSHILREDSLYFGSRPKSCDILRMKGKVKAGESFYNLSEMEARPRAVTFGDVIDHNSSRTSTNVSRATAYSSNSSKKGTRL